MRQWLKFIHTLAAVGMGGALASLLLLLVTLPEDVAIDTLAATRHHLDLIARFLLLPSMAVAVVSGLLAMASGPRYHSAGWAWAKLVSGIVVFEGTLLTVRGFSEEEALGNPGQRAAEVLGPEQLAQQIASEWVSLWVITALVIANIALGVWRPRFGGRKTDAP